MTREEIVEGIIKQHERAAIYGDRTAAQRLHALLASCLRQGELTPYMTDLLARMHEAIANGENADTAMKTKRPRNRPTDSTLDHDLYLFIEAEKLIRTFKRKDRSRRRVAMKRLYADAADKFGVSERTAEGIYGKQRKEHGSFTP